MERLALDRWASPWLRNQHVARYEWAAARYARGASVLDAACGSGYGSRSLEGAGAERVTSVDLSLDAFAEARRLEGADALRFVRGDAARLPVAADSCDLYTSFETIEHVDDDGGLVAEARRVLRPDGVFLCSTPNRELLSPGNTIDDRPANPYHVREYSIGEFRELLERSFDSVTLYGQTWFRAAHARRLARVGRLGNVYAVRLHQFRNIVGVLGESPARHLPVPLDDPPGADRVPEVVIAVCR